MKLSTCEPLQTGMHVQSSHLHQPVYCGYFLPCWVLRTTNVAWTGHLASSAPVFSVSSAIQPNFVEPYTANQKNLMSAMKWYLFGIQDWPWIIHVAFATLFQRWFHSRVSSCHNRVVVTRGATMSNFWGLWIAIIQIPMPDWLVWILIASQT